MEPISNNLQESDSTTTVTHESEDNKQDSTNIALADSSAEKAKSVNKRKLDAADKDEKLKSPKKEAKQGNELSAQVEEDNPVKQERQERLDKLKQEILKDVNLPLASQFLVFGRGDPVAEMVFIGEAPGENEEVYGQPFTGPSGRLLNSLLVDMGFAIEKNTYVCNVLKYRPPDNRDPTTKEVQLHTPYLLRQLDIINPKLIVPLGNWATKYVLSGFDPKKMSKVEGMVKVHGQKFVVTSPRGDMYHVIPAFHPAAALHNKQWEPALREDFHKIKTFIQSEEFKIRASQTTTSPMKKQKTLDSFFGGPKQNPITSFFSASKK